MITIDVILPLAIADTYTYSVPDGMTCPEPGMRVLVPLARKTITGVVLRRHPENADDSVSLSPDRIRPILEVLDGDPHTHDMGEDGNILTDIPE